MTGAARTRATDGPARDCLVAAGEHPAACSEQVVLIDFDKAASLPTGLDGRGGHMMVASIEVIRGGRMDPASTCVVCRDAIPAGSGLAARFGNREFRFKCAACLARFEADPARYLASPETACCNDGHYPSPASEWACY